LNPPQGEKFDYHSTNFVGTLSLFGLKPHAMSGDTSAAAKPAFAEYDITRPVRDLRTRGGWNARALSVVLVPRGLVGRDGEPLPLPGGIQGTLAAIVLATQ